MQSVYRDRIAWPEWHTSRRRHRKDSCRCGGSRTLRIWILLVAQIPAKSQQRIGYYKFNPGQTISIWIPPYNKLYGQQEKCHSRVYAFSSSFYPPVPKTPPLGAAPIPLTLRSRTLFRGLPRAITKARGGAPNSRQKRGAASAVPPEAPPQQREDQADGHGQPRHGEQQPEHAVPAAAVGKRAEDNRAQRAADIAKGVDQPRQQAGVGDVAAGERNHAGQNVVDRRDGADGDGEAAQRRRPYAEAQTRKQRGDAGERNGEERAAERNMVCQPPVEPHGEKRAGNGEQGQRQRQDDGNRLGKIIQLIEDVRRPCRQAVLNKVGKNGEQKQDAQLREQRPAQPFLRRGRHGAFRVFPLLFGQTSVFGA